MSSNKRLALVCGSGDLVPRALAAAREAGWVVRVLVLQPREDLEVEKPFHIKVSRPDQVFREIKAFKATAVCAVGGFHMSDKAREDVSALSVEKDKSSKGDSKLSQIGSGILKMLGIPFIGVHELVNDVLAPMGQFGAVMPTESQMATLKFAFSSVLKAGELDLGQALVASGQRIIATEDIGGTDELLERVARYSNRGLIGDGEAKVVLAKSAKPGQPLHIDMPAIGPDTIDGCVAAGISCIVVEAGRTLLIRREDLISLADSNNIVLYGMTS